MSSDDTETAPQDAGEPPEMPWLLRELLAKRYADPGYWQLRVPDKPCGGN